MSQVSQELHSLLEDLSFDSRHSSGVGGTQGRGLNPTRVGGSLSLRHVCSTLRVERDRGSFVVDHYPTPTACAPLSVPYYLYPTTCTPLPVPHYLRPTACPLVPAPHYLPPTACPPLPTPYYLRPTTYPTACTPLPTPTTCAPLPVPYCLHPTVYPTTKVPLSVPHCLPLLSVPHCLRPTVCTPLSAPHCLCPTTPYCRRPTACPLLPPTTQHPTILKSRDQRGRTPTLTYPSSFRASPGMGHRSSPRVQKASQVP